MSGLFFHIHCLRNIPLMVPLPSELVNIAQPLTKQGSVSLELKDENAISYIGFPLI